WAVGSRSASHVNISLDLAWQLDDSACSVPHSILRYPADIAAFSDVPPDAPCNLTLRPSLFGVLLTIPHSHYDCGFLGNPKILHSALSILHRLPSADACKPHDRSAQPWF